MNVAKEIAFVADIWQVLEPLIDARKLGTAQDILAEELRRRGFGLPRIMREIVFRPVEQSGIWKTKSSVLDQEIEDAYGGRRHAIN